MSGFLQRQSPGPLSRVIILGYPPGFTVRRFPPLLSHLKFHSQQEFHIDRKSLGALAQLVERRSTYSPPRTAKRPLPRPQWTMGNLVGNLTKWGIGTAGSALHSHCRGHRFDSGMLHHPQSLEITGFQGFFDAQIQDGNICHICSLWFEF